MFIAKVTGSLVSTQKVDAMVGYKLLLVEPFRLDADSRKSLVTTRALRAGTVIDHSMVTAKRPGTGIATMFFGQFTFPKRRTCRSIRSLSAWSIRCTWKITPSTSEMKIE